MSYLKASFQAFILHKSCLSWGVDYDLENTIKRWWTVEKSMIITPKKCRDLDSCAGNLINLPTIPNGLASFQTSFYCMTSYTIFALNSKVHLTTQKARGRIQRCNWRVYQSNPTINNIFTHSMRHNHRIIMSRLPWTTVRWSWKVSSCWVGTLFLVWSQVYQ